MCEIKKLLPVDALMAMLEVSTSSSIFLRMDVAHTLAAACTEEACDLCIRLVLDPEEHLWLREILIGDFVSKCCSLSFREKEISYLEALAMNKGVDLS